MKLATKSALIGFTSLALTFGSLTNVQAAPKDPEFAYALKHSNFIPPLMSVLMKNQSKLNLSDKQLADLKSYHKSHSPLQRKDMKQVVVLEKQAAAASLKGDLAEAEKLGQKTIDLRQSIMNQKLSCHKMMQNALSEEQYQTLLKLAK